jgi:hypothetical protein
MFWTNLSAKIFTQHYGFIEARTKHQNFGVHDLERSAVKA